MNTRHMNTRIVLSAALAASILCTPALAQAPRSSYDQNLEAKVQSLQAQVNALQAQIKRLQAEVRVLIPRRGVTPIDQVPPLQVPLFQVPSVPGQGGFGGRGSFGGGGSFGPNKQTQPFQDPGILQDPGIQGYLFPSPQSRQQLFAVPQPYSNIPPCAITLISQKTR